MIETLYVLDVDIFIDIGGAGKASYDIMIGLTSYCKIIFIPKYAAYDKIKNKHDKMLFIEHMHYLRELGIYVPDILLELTQEIGVKYNTYLEIISKIIEEDSTIFDLNYFPELEPNDIKSVIKSFFYDSEIMFLKRTKKCKTIALLQTLDNRPVNSHTYFALKSFTAYQIFNLKLLFKSFYRNIKDPISTKHLIKSVDLILVYSIGLLKSLGQYKEVNKFKVLSIGNTIDENINHDVKDKSNYIIFYSRLIYEKGIFDLLEIFKIILKTTGTRLIITGKFPDRKIEQDFFKKAKKYNLDGMLEYKGFVEIRELKRLISNAKVFLYPTHYDSFPYAILEAISSFTVVITYSLPSILNSYESLQCVYTINEFDINNMAKKTIEVLNLSNDAYLEIFNDNKIKEFINKHMDKKSSAKEIYKFISEL